MDTRNNYKSDRTQVQGRDEYTEHDFNYTPRVGSEEDVIRNNNFWETDLIWVIRRGDVTYDRGSTPTPTPPIEKPSLRLITETPGLLSGRNVVTKGDKYKWGVSGVIDNYNPEKNYTPVHIVFTSADMKSECGVDVDVDEQGVFTYIAEGDSIHPITSPITVKATVGVVDGDKTEISDIATDTINFFFLAPNVEITADDIPDTPIQYGTMGSDLKMSGEFTLQPGVVLKSVTATVNGKNTILELVDDEAPTYKWNLTGSNNLFEIGENSVGVSVITELDGGGEISRNISAAHTAISAVVPPISSIVIFAPDEIETRMPAVAKVTLEITPYKHNLTLNIEKSEFTINGKRAELVDTSSAATFKTAIMVDSTELDGGDAVVGVKAVFDDSEDADNDYFQYNEVTIRAAKGDIILPFVVTRTGDVINTDENATEAQKHVKLVFGLSTDLLPNPDLTPTLKIINKSDGKEMYSAKFGDVESSFSVDMYKDFFKDYEETQFTLILKTDDIVSTDISGNPITVHGYQSELDISLVDGSLLEPEIFQPSFNTYTTPDNSGGMIVNGFIKSHVQGAKPKSVSINNGEKTTNCACTVVDGYYDGRVYHYSTNIQLPKSATKRAKLSTGSITISAAVTASGLSSQPTSLTAILP